MPRPAVAGRGQRDDGEARLGDAVERRRHHVVGLHGQRAAMADDDGAAAVGAPAVTDRRLGDLPERIRRRVECLIDVEVERQVGVERRVEDGVEPSGQVRRHVGDAAEAAAKFLTAADGPRIGALSYNGWDTHANEGVVKGVLGNRLAGLDLALKTFHDGTHSSFRRHFLSAD